MGVKPLYYATTTDGFLFGSEIKALLEEPNFPRDIDPVAMHNTLAHLRTFALSPSTMLRAMLALPLSKNEYSRYLPSLIG